jgi:hypothetical protein
MNHPTQFPDDGQNRIVYIRTVDPQDLPEDARDSVGDAPVYAIHDSEGKRLALVADRALAFVVARQNEMTPVSVH